MVYRHVTDLRSSDSHLTVTVALKAFLFHSPFTRLMSMRSRELSQEAVPRKIHMHTPNLTPTVSPLSHDISV